MTVTEISQLTWHSQSSVKVSVTIVYCNDVSNESYRNLSRIFGIDSPQWRQTCQVSWEISVTVIRCVATVNYCYVYLHWGLSMSSQLRDFCYFIRYVVTVSYCYAYLHWGLSMPSQLRDFCNCHQIPRYSKLLLRLPSLRTINAKSAERFL
jgi:glycogen synthase